MTDTKNGVAVITGGGSGIGEACARRFAGDGYTIALVDQNREHVERVATDIGADGRRVSAHVCDVSDPEALTALAAEIESNSGPVSALVTAAGILNNADTFLEMDLDEHQRVWDVNYNGTIYSVRAFAPAMAERRRGAIVTLGSVNSYIQLPLPAYNPSKMAIMRVTELLCVELGRNGVRVNGIAPGYTMTPNILRRIESGDRDPRIVRDSQALDMLIQPGHIADAAAFLCSDQAEAITGVMLPVDAGFLSTAYYKSYAGGVPWDK